MFQACTSQTWTKCGSSLVIQSANWAISKNLSSSCKSLARIQRALEIRPRKPPSATVVKARTGGAFSSGATRVRPSRSRSAFNPDCTREAPASNSAARSRSRIFFGLPLIPSSLRSLGGGQLTAGKYDNADQAQDAAEQANDLANG